MNREVTFYYEDEDESVVEFRFDAIDMDSRQLFIKWVQFMNAIGYVLDYAEMEAMWNGELPELDEKERDRRSALEHGMFS